MGLEKLPALKIIGARQIEGWLDAHAERVLQLVERAYVDFAEERAINPDSYFLRFPDSDCNRIIALPAVLEDDRPIAGIKWIASFPGNVARRIDRASALLILNDRHTGYPLACMEGGSISAARTAASAVLGARYLHPTPGRIVGMGIVGCGPIAFRTVRMLSQLGWSIGSLRLHDVVAERAELFAKKCAQLGLAATPAALEPTVRHSDAVLFATSAVRPNVGSLAWFEHCPTVLHLSLRDLAPEIVLAAQNLADDVAHCLKANTSLDLAQQRVGHHYFVDGGMADAIGGRILADPNRVRIFSPFGMGMLDLTVAREILYGLDVAETVMVEDFFPTPYQSAGG